MRGDVSETHPESSKGKEFSGSSEAQSRELGGLKSLRGGVKNIKMEEESREGGG